MSKKIAYHIDRNNNIHNNYLELNTSEFLDVCQLSKYFNMMYENGLSNHGITYLSDINAFQNLQEFNNMMIEHFVEFVRVIKFPNIPSRFQCLFAIPSLEDINKWPELSGDYSIYEIEYDTDKVAILDANQLNGGINTNGNYSPCTNIVYAEKYLSGELSESPKLEILIPLPVKIGKKIR